MKITLAVSVHKENAPKKPQLDIRTSTTTTSFFQMLLLGAVVACAMAEDPEAKSEGYGKDLGGEFGFAFCFWFFFRRVVTSRFDVGAQASTTATSSTPTCRRPTSTSSDTTAAIRPTSRRATNRPRRVASAPRYAATVVRRSISTGISFSASVTSSPQVKWADAYSGYGEHYYEYNHAPYYHIAAKGAVKGVY